MAATEIKSSLITSITITKLLKSTYKLVNLMVSSSELYVFTA